MDKFIKAVNIIAIVIIISGIFSNSSNNIVLGIAILVVTLIVSLVITRNSVKKDEILLAKTAKKCDIEKQLENFAKNGDSIEEIESAVSVLFPVLALFVVTYRQNIIPSSPGRYLSNDWPGRDQVYRKLIQYLPGLIRDPEIITMKGKTASNMVLLALSHDTGVPNITVLDLIINELLFYKRDGDPATWGVGNSYAELA